MHKVNQQKQECKNGLHIKNKRINITHADFSIRKNIYSNQKPKQKYAILEHEAPKPLKSKL